MRNDIAPRRSGAARGSPSSGDVSGFQPHPRWWKTGLSTTAAHYGKRCSLCPHAGPAGDVRHRRHHPHRPGDDQILYSTAINCGARRHRPLDTVVYASLIRRLQPREFALEQIVHRREKNPSGLARSCDRGLAIANSLAAIAAAQPGSCSREFTGRARRQYADGADAGEPAPLGSIDRRLSRLRET